MQSLSNNVAHAQNIAILVAAAELGTESIIRSLGNDTSATTLDGAYLTKEDIQSALVGRITKHLNA